MDFLIFIGGITLIVVIVQKLWSDIIGPKTEDDLYEIATNETGILGKRNNGLWKKSLTLTQGNKKEAKYIYIDLKVKQLAKEYDIELSKETLTHKISVPKHKDVSNIHIQKPQETTSNMKKYLLIVLKVIGFLVFLVAITGIISAFSETYKWVGIIWLILLYLVYKFVASNERSVTGLIVFIVLTILLKVALTIGPMVFLSNGTNF